MAKQKQQERRVVSGLERLGMRVSAMINAPMAQLNRQVTIHRLDTDCDEDWDAVMQLLAEEDGIEMTFNDDGTVLLKWEQAGDDDRAVGEGDLLAAEELKAEAAPF